MLYSRELCILSVGTSCQAEWQAHKNIELIAGITGIEHLTKRGTYLDYIITQPGCVIEWLREGGPAIPPLEELYIHGGRPRWDRYGFHFWHDFPRQEGSLEMIRENYENFISKRAHVRKNFDLAGRAKKLIVLWSNLQNNIHNGYIPEVCLDPVDYGVLMALKQEVARFFDRDIEFVVTTRPDRIVNPPAADDGLVIFEPDTSSWEGSDSQWTALFKRLLGAG
ncbi:hypothetical protein SAMN02949497_3909 [Methylomagnum ishizawai]|uniref:Papain-like cysteine peptidase n=2 Tax=Methylomagnum ishizawai TaxID=1760988 RepID=A0A1Y6D0Q2_9GAMM|nr:hypothetical protein SAMN02949497_3909 [Methylomagnum ishizawai]